MRCDYARVNIIARDCRHVCRFDDEMIFYALLFAVTPPRVTLCYAMIIRQIVEWRYAERYARLRMRCYAARCARHTSEYASVTYMLHPPLLSR